MSQGESLDGLAARRDALRQAANVPGADPGALLDAALTELDAAIDALAFMPAEEQGMAGLPDAVRAERRLLQAAFQQAPAPLLLLEPDGTIRRANASASRLLGTSAGYVAGKALNVFVDPPLRAALQSQLAAVIRTREPRRFACRLLTPDGPSAAVLAVSSADLPGGDQPLLVATITPGKARLATGSAERDAPAPAAPAPKPSSLPDASRAVKSLTRRLDTVAAVTRLLLDNSTFSEAVTLQRCARLLAGELADWVIVDVARDGGLRRQLAIGPRDEQAVEAARVARSIEPDPSTLPWQVHDTRQPVLLAHVGDQDVLGAGPGGTPLIMAIGAASLLVVPISDGTDSYGALTLARLAGSGRFDIADLALVEEIGGHLAIAMRVDRMFRRRSEAAEALQASLLPERLPDVPGLEFAAAYGGATQWQEASGDFYDVFRFLDGWAVAIGDVCGRGQDAAAMTAAARHAIRALAHVPAHDTPGDVLTAANEVLVSGDYGERFVTASLAFMRRRGRKMQVRLATSGHPGPAVLRADGRVEIVEGDGLPLGMFPDGAPSTASLDLVPGDMLFFYTDGVSNARNAESGFFEDRLADSLAAMAGRSAAETVRAVQDLVTEFSGGELRDDVTILAVKVS
jgi:PAS domain S-box-containing protein